MRLDDGLLPGVVAVTSPLSEMDEDFLPEAPAAPTGVAERLPPAAPNMAFSLTGSNTDDHDTLHQKGF